MLQGYLQLPGIIQEINNQEYIQYKKAERFPIFNTFLYLTTSTSKLFEK